jgi:hypothetical protein
VTIAGQQNRKRQVSPGFRLACDREGVGCAGWVRRLVHDVCAHVGNLFNLHALRRAVSSRATDLLTVLVTRRDTMYTLASGCTWRRLRRQLTSSQAGPLGQAPAGEGLFEAVDRALPVDVSPEAAWGAPLS